MWKAFLVFVSQRLLLLLAACVVINLHLPDTREPGPIPEIHTFREIWPVFLAKVKELPEPNAIQVNANSSWRTLVTEVPSPFIWFGVGLHRSLGISPEYSVLILANLILLLFFSELYGLFSRVMTPEAASSAVSLAVLWPTGYELSMGSSYGLNCLFAMMVVRAAIDNHWLISGLAMAGLSLIDPLAVGLLPFVLFTFVYFQRHFFISQVIKRAFFFLVPTVAVMAWRYPLHATVPQVVSHSFFVSLWRAVTAGDGWAWLFSAQSSLQLATFGVMLVGLVTSMFGNLMFIHRLVPLNYFCLWGLFNPYSQLASTAFIASPCFQGIAGASSPFFLGVIHVGLISLSIYEIFLLF